MHQTNRSNEQNASNSFQPWINISQSLVEEALDRWDSKELRADNVSVVCVIFNTLQEEQQNSKISSAIHQMSSIEVGQHILLDHCYEETFKLKMLESLTCGYNDEVINRDTHESLNPTISQFTANNQYIGEDDDKSNIFDNCMDKFYYNDSSLDRSIVSHEIEKVSEAPSCSNNSMMVTDEHLELKDERNSAEMEESYPQLKMPKINNKENSKILKKVRTSSNKFYETRQMDRKMRSGHVFSSTISETTRRRSAKLQLPVINDSYPENSKGCHKKANNSEFINSSPIEGDIKALRSPSSYFLKDTKEFDPSSTGESKYLKMNNIFLSTRKRKLFGTKSTKRPYSEKITKKNSVSQSKH